MPFDYEPFKFGKRVDGWSMSGFYKTVTDKYGDSYLRVSANLEGPTELDVDRTHKAELFIGSILHPKSEWFEC